MGMRVKNGWVEEVEGRLEWREMHDVVSVWYLFSFCNFTFPVACCSC